MARTIDERLQRAEALARKRGPELDPWEELTDELLKRIVPAFGRQPTEAELNRFALAYCERCQTVDDFSSDSFPSDELCEVARNFLNEMERHPEKWMDKRARGRRRAKGAAKQAKEIACCH